MGMSGEKLYFPLYLKGLSNLFNRMLILNYYKILKCLRIFQRNLFQSFVIQFKIKHLRLKILFLMLVLNFVNNLFSNVKKIN